MEKLIAFEKKWSKRFRRVPSGIWMSDITDIRLSGRPMEIARRAGYSPREDMRLYQISRRAAARVLAYVQKESLAYGRRQYREGLAVDMYKMLGELGPQAEFWSNGRYKDFEEPQPKVPATAWDYNPLTQSSFDTGIIAFNDETGFMFWVEEED